MAVSSVNWYSFATIIISAIAVIVTLVRFMEHRFKAADKDRKKERRKSEKKQRARIVKIVGPMMTAALTDHMATEEGMIQHAANVAQDTNAKLQTLAETVGAHLDEDARFQREVWARVNGSVLPVRDEVN